MEMGKELVQFSYKLKDLKRPGLEDAMNINDPQEFTKKEDLEVIILGLDEDGKNETLEIPFDVFEDKMVGYCQE